VTDLSRKTVLRYIGQPSAFVTRISSWTYFTASLAYWLAVSYSLQ